jgi:hypothetical protein
LRFKFPAQNRELTVNALREIWFGEDQNNRTLLTVIKSGIMDLEKLVAKGIYKRSTLVKYKTTEKHLLDISNGERMDGTGIQHKTFKKLELA